MTSNYTTDVVPRSSRAQAVAELIESHIAEEKLADGVLLGTKDSLRRRYGVALATLNESIRLLTARGTIAVKSGPKGGIFVASPTPLVRLGRKMLELSGESVSVTDCLVVRKTLDPLVTEEATRHRTEADIHDLREIVARMAQPDIAMSEYLSINWELHRRMVQITPNEILRHTYLSLLDFVDARIRNVTPDDTKSPISAGARIHAELVEAIASGDQLRSKRASAEHSKLTATPEEDR